MERLSLYGSEYTGFSSFLASFSGFAFSVSVILFENTMVWEKSFSSSSFTALLSAGAVSAISEISIISVGVSASSSPITSDEFAFSETRISCGTMNISGHEENASSISFFDRVRFADFEIYV